MQTRTETAADIYDIVETAIEEKGLDCECVGGGRIDHDPGNKRIKIYGYSKGYGRADHSVTFLVLQKKFGSNYNITFSNEGY
ncbi:14 kDa phosphohistidine phosphatase-like [Mizuhopecten yessoensis]|uniref:14 kDa phosphohistidine phosphatase-like n=1 Tax=Mizuhopecten yessoensis TaxID=6573 RepID=UPI000B459076|nr:14 kDa phosphohistidine phosphatase-like [Mizuhopecten yessoensis]